MIPLQSPVEHPRRSGKQALRTVVVAAVALLSGELFATAAFAGCGVDMVRQPTSLRGAYASKATLTKASYDDNAPIVGLWSVTFTDDAGNLNDYGYQQWHSDGTEILNSGTHSPASQNFCLGVWKAVGRNHFLLNHFALSYDAGASTPTLKINIKEDVTVKSSDDVYEGVFSQDVFVIATGAQVAHIVGKVTGERIKVTR